MTTEQLKEIKRFNDNIEWLKNSQAVPVTSDLITMKETMSLINRQRTWIQVRMVKDLHPGQDADSHLVRDVDWIREGNRVMFKRDSILRLKNEVLTAIGNKYDNI
jgi:hypothetical protein